MQRDEIFVQETQGLSLTVSFEVQIAIGIKKTERATTRIDCNRHAGL